VKIYRSHGGWTYELRIGNRVITSWSPGTRAQCEQEARGVLRQMKEAV
jgi:hypothetical protein